MPLPIRFFTIVLNGMPFLKHHLPMMQKLSVPWEWHVAEGLADLRHDTAWSLRKRWSIRKPFRWQTSGWLPHEMHSGGRSVDGTSQYLDEIAAADPRVNVWRKPVGTFWDGKREMVQAASANLAGESLLWQIDSDELWTTDQIHTAHQMFSQSPEKTAARYWCHYFVGPELEILDRGGYGNGPEEWLRTWRARPGDAWQAHEPPLLVRDGKKLCQNAFTQAETEARGLVFEHYAYVTAEQVAFKEAYYGYRKAVRHWHQLQKAQPPIELDRYLPWVRHPVRVGYRPAARLAHFDPATRQWTLAAENGRSTVAA